MNPQPKVLIIDEHDCFGRVKEFVDSDPQIIKPSYFLANNRNCFDDLVKACLASNVVIVHRHIWVDDCHQDDPPCNAILSELKQKISPIPLLEVGGLLPDNSKCPDDMLSAFSQIAIAVKNLGKLIGAEVCHPSPYYNSMMMTIADITMLGNGVVGTVLVNEHGEKRKYFELRKLVLHTGH